MLYTALLLMILLLTIGVIAFFSVVITRQLKKSNYISSTQYGELVQILQDKHELHRFGYGQYLKRSYSDFNAFHMSFMHMGMMVTLMFTANYLFASVSISLSLFIFIIVSLFYVFTAIANGRLLSSQPTSGGLYHVLFRQVGSIWASSIGVIKIFAQLAATVLYSFIVFTLLAALFKPIFPQINQTTSIIIGMIVIMISQAIIANMRSVITRWMQGVGILLFWIVLIGISLCILFIVLPNGYSPFYFLLGESPNVVQQASNQMVPIAFAVLIIAKCFAGQDESSANAEETIEPKIKVPWATFLSTSYSVVFGFVFLTMLGIIYFNVSSGSYPSYSTEQWISGLLALPPVLQFLLISLLVIVGWYNGLFTVVNGSRHMMAMARDTLLPLSNKLANITLFRQTPHYAILMYAILSSIIAIAFSCYSSHTLFITHLLALIVFGYSSIYFLTNFLTFFRLDAVLIWTFNKGIKAVQVLAIIFNIILVTISAYFLSWQWITIILIVATLNGLYTYLSHGYIKLNVQKALNKQEFEHERNFPLQ